MVSVTNPLMDSEIWGANLAGRVVCRSNKAVAPHPTISAVPSPDATLTRLIRRHVESNLPLQVLILTELQMQKACSLSRLFEFGR